ncbi:hypothetical protein AVEN_138322-1 [Araneus ventricosus]|uniref:Uncharacterized protein n=1 Tax=Araneus ventricosus TaxID=182803 RepID=A0A4Y2J0M5_ARAVE|nr:hypothetical protein AVEN_138322-1 [Araneus ventricosus]
MTYVGITSVPRNTVSGRRWAGLTRSRQTVVFRPLMSMVTVLSLFTTLYEDQCKADVMAAAHDLFLKRCEMKILVKDGCRIDRCSERMLQQDLGVAL